VYNLGTMTPEGDRKFKKTVTLGDSKQVFVSSGGERIIVLECQTPDSLKHENHRKHVVPEGTIPTLIPLIREAFPDQNYGEDDDAFFQTIEMKRQEVEGSELPEVSYRRALARLRQARFSRFEIARATLKHFNSVRAGNAFGDLSEKDFNAMASTLASVFNNYWPGRVLKSR
jgi:hypothetical protein